MRVQIPTHLRQYTGAAELEVRGATVGEVLSEIDRCCPGFRFRIVDEQDAIRQHISIFVNVEPARSLGAPVQPGDRIKIVAALSGG